MTTITNERKGSRQVRYLRMLGLCMVAAGAIAVVTSASASAMGAPEWGRCLKVPVTIKGKEHKKGKYGNANCTEAGSEYEFVKGTEELPGGTGFKAIQTSEKAELQTALGISVECTGTEATGNVHGTSEVNEVSVTFKGCELPALNFSCQNVFHTNETEFKYEYTEGELVTRKLKGKLGYISGKGTAEPKVGLELEPEEKAGLFAEFQCGAKGHGIEGGPLIIRVGGKEKHGGGDAIISPVTPINTMATTLTQTYEEKLNEAGEREQGIQNPQSFETGKKDTLESEASFGEGTFGWTASGQVETLNTTLNSGEELEIKA